MLWGCGNNNEDKSDSGYHLYYIDKEASRLIAEEYEPQTDTAEKMVGEFVETLSKDPEEVGLKKALPESVTILNYRLEDKLLYISFDSGYMDMGKVREILCRTALVKTFTQIPGVDCISIYIKDQPLRNSKDQPVGLLTPDNFIEDLGAELQSERKSTELTLYFANEAGDKLVAETRKVTYDSNISIEKAIVEQLIKGPESEGAYRTISEEAKLLSISVKDSICYVNFNDGFLKTTPEGLKTIAIYSVVNSLSEVSGINKVQITINGKADKAYLETIYERNLDMIETKGK